VAALTRAESSSERIGASSSFAAGLEVTGVMAAGCSAERLHPEQNNPIIPSASTVSDTDFITFFTPSINND